MINSKINLEEVRSFTFTLDTPDENIIDLCKEMNISEKEAYKLIDIKNKYIKSDAYTQVV